MSIERNETYKTFKGFKYHLNIPDEWIIHELPLTGRECWNCVGRPSECDGFAMWRTIILGYCGNCAKDYQGERGKGFIGLGVENNINDYQSAFDLYLGPVDFETYGDLADNDEDTLENREHFIEAEEKFMEEERLLDALADSLVKERLLNEEKRLLEEKRLQEGQRLENEELENEELENEELENEELENEELENEELEDEESEDDYYGEEEDDYGECLHIGCGEPSLCYSAYCRRHFELFEYGWEC